MKFFWYIFPFFNIVGILGVLWARQTIYALLFLIIIYVSSSICWISVGVELIGLILIIVYIGAITMLLLYMVMFLDAIKTQKDTQYDYFNKTVGMVFILYVYYILHNYWPENILLLNGWINSVFLINDINVLSINLFEQHSFAVILVGFVLLIAMIIALDIAKWHKSQINA